MGHNDSDSVGQIQWIIHLGQWTENININMKSLGFSEKVVMIKYYESLPLDFFWRQDNNLFIGPYLKGIGSQQTLTYHYRIDSEVGKFFLNYFDTLWNDPVFCMQ